jgi:hypothetical protein
MRFASRDNTSLLCTILFLQPIFAYHCNAEGRETLHWAASLKSSRIPGHRKPLTDSVQSNSYLLRVGLMKNGSSGALTTEPATMRIVGLTSPKSTHRNMHWSLSCLFVCSLKVPMVIELVQEE